MCLCVGGIGGGSGGGGSNVDRTLRFALIMRICIMLYHMPN